MNVALASAQRWISDNIGGNKQQYFSSKPPNLPTCVRSEPLNNLWQNNEGAEERSRHQSVSPPCLRWELPPRQQARAPLGIVWGIQANLFASIIHSKDLSNLQMSVNLLVQEAGRQG